MSSLSDSLTNPSTLNCKVLSLSKNIIGQGISYPAWASGNQVIFSFDFLTLRDFDYVSGVGQLSTDFTSICGTLIKYDQSQPGNRGKSELFECFLPGMATLEPVKSGEIVRGLSSIRDRTFEVMIDDENDTGISRAYTLRIKEGYLFVNGDFMPSVEYDGNKIEWFRCTSDGAYETGKFEFRDLHLLRGTGSLTHEAPLSVSILRSPAKSTSNATVIASLSQYLIIDEEPWDFYLNIAIMIDGSMSPTLKDMSTGEDFTSAIVSTMNVNNEQDLKYTISIPESACDLLGVKYIYGEGTMNSLATASSGVMYSYDPSTEDNRGERHDLQGTDEKPDLSTGNSSGVTPPPPHLTDPGSSSSTTDGGDNITDPFPSNDLNIENLIHMAPPDNNTVSETTQNKIVSWAIYCMTDDQRELISVDIPTLPQEESEFLQDDEIHDFFQNVFATAYIAMGLRQVSNFDHSWTTDVDVDVQLQYFWQGTMTGTLGGYPAFSKAQDFANTRSFLEATGSTLNPFLNSSSPTAAKWAQMLYDELMSKAMFNNMCTQYTEGDSHQVVKYSNILLCLDPTQSLTNSLWNQVGWGALVCHLDKFRTTDNVDIDAFTDEAFEQIILAILKDEDGVVFRDLHDLAYQAMADLGISSSKSLESMASELSDALKEYRTVCKETINANKYVFLPKRTRELMENLDERFPAAASYYEFAVAVVGILGFALAVFSLIETFIDWKNLSLGNKIEAVVAAMVSVVQGIATFNTTYAAIRKVMKASSKANFSPSKAVEGESEMVDSLKTGEVATSVSETADDVAVEGIAYEGLEDNMHPGLLNMSSTMSEVTSEEGVSAATKWLSKVVNVSEKIAEGLNVLGLAAATVTLGFQCKRDFSDNSSLAIKIVDITNTIITGVATMIAFSCFVVGASIPVVGIALVALGVVLQLISFFLHKYAPPPETPQEIWIESTGNEFIKGVPPPTADFALNQMELKPTALMTSGSTPEGYISNLFDIEIQSDEIITNGKFTPLQALRLADLLRTPAACNSRYS